MSRIMFFILLRLLSWCLSFHRLLSTLKSIMWLSAPMDLMSKYLKMGPPCTAIRRSILSHWNLESFISPMTRTLIHLPSVTWCRQQEQLCSLRKNSLRLHNHFLKKPLSSLCCGQFFSVWSWSSQLSTSANISAMSGKPSYKLLKSSSITQAELKTCRGLRVAGCIGLPMRIWSDIQRE